MTAKTNFNTVDSMVVIALYNADGSLAEVSLDGSMTMPFDFSDGYMKAFVMDKASLRPQCDYYLVKY